MCKKDQKSTEKNRESMEVKRSQIIYKRLKQEYLEKGERSDEKLGEYYFEGMSKQGIGYRRKNGVVDVEEILDAFPDINYEWITSTDIKALRQLPVRQKSIDRPASSDETQDTEEKPQLSRGQVKELLGQIEGFVRTLKDNL